MEAIVDARQEPFSGELTWFEYEIGHPHLGHALVRSHRAAGRLAIRPSCRVRVVQVALEDTIRDQLIASWGHTLAIERPAGQTFRQPRVIGDGDDPGRYLLAELSGQQRAPLDA